MSNKRGGDSILYELLVYSEWLQEPEILLKLTKPQNTLFRIATKPWTLKYYLPRSETVNDKIERLISARLPWQIAVGEEGKIVAVIQDTMLEIRTARDEYSSVIGKASITRDLFPQYRKAVWSPDCSLLACAFSSGRIGLYDLLGSNILTIQPKNNNGEEWPTTEEAIASIFFLEDRIKSPKWSYELIAVDYRGNLRSFLVSPTEGFREHHVFTFASYYRNGITAAHLLQSRNLLILSGPSNIELEQKGRGSSAGLSAWRILSDHPFYSPALSSEEDLISIQGSRGVWNWISSAFRSVKQSDVLVLRISPNGRYIACLHASGAISLWQIPSLRLYKYWNLSDQPDHNVCNPLLLEGHDKTNNADSLDFLPVDISWWNENVLIIARFSGAVSVCSISDLHNLLGEYPEFFAGSPQISSASSDGKGFLSLECEVNVSSKQDTLDDSMDQTEDMSSDELDGENSFIGRSSNAIKNTLYWITDSDRFRPPRPKPRILKRTYRLLGLKSTTPEELYNRKINNEEYGEALQLAKTYGLDSDLVFQRQWRSQKVSITSIHDYLSKITKRSWVLGECIDRVPETTEAAKELLRFGLQVTSLKTLISVNSETSEQLSNEMDEENNKELDTNEIISQLKYFDLNNEQQEIIRFRHIILQYLDMLSTYELIMTGENNDCEEMYDATFYSKFRSQSLLQSVVEFARNGQWEAVSTMLTYHSKELLKHRLPILSCFPETMDPFKYRALLPECEDDKVIPWPVKVLREKDWCEEISPLDETPDAYFNILYKESELEDYCDNCLSPEQLCAWYITRANQLEARSKMVDNSLSLITLGQERSVQGLDLLMSELLTLEVLVYEVQIEDLSLLSLRKHSDLSQAHLLTSKSSVSTFVEDAKRWLLPHLIRCERKNAGSKKQIIKEYLKDLSVRSLVLPSQIFKLLKSEQPGPFFSSLEEAVIVALDCLYSYPNTDQLKIAFEILECLPERGFGEKNKKMIDLHNRVDKLEGHLIGAEILLKYTENGLSLKQLKDISELEEPALRIFYQISASLIKKIPPANQNQWNELLKDMLKLQAKVFNCILVEKCFEIYAESLLASGHRTNIRYVGTIMECSKTEHQTAQQQKIRYDIGVNLVLKASRKYFDSSDSFNDPNMELAKSCLLLISDENTLIKEELDLISALQLLSDFGVKMLPVQVRLCSDKLKLLREALKIKQTSYRSTQRLLQLANYLRISDDDLRAREAAVLILVAEVALQAGDYKFCAETCEKMIDRRHASGWKITKLLAECKDYEDIEMKHSLLAFAILYCDPEAIEDLISFRCKLEAQLIYREINKKIPADSKIAIFPTSPSLDEFSDALSSPEVEIRPFSSIIPQKLPQFIQQSAEVLREKTRNVLSNVSNEIFWRSTFNWMQKEETRSVVDNILTQGFHTFYMGLHSSNCHESGLGVHYDNFTPAIPNDPSLDLLVQLVRVSLLEELEQSDDVSLTDDLILKAGEEIIMEDCHIGLSLLFSLRDVSRAKELFLHLPQSFVTLQLAAYYFALIICIEELPKDDIQTKHNVFCADPNKLIDMVHKGEIKNGIETDKSKSARTLLNSFISQQSELLLTLQLQSLDCGVDPLRFSHDSQYRQDSILGLAMTDDEEQFELAQTFAEKFEIPLSHLAVARLSHFLLEQDEFSQEKLETLLKELDEYLDESIVERMEKEVLDNIHGTDHQRLLSFFISLREISESSIIYNLNSNQHIKLIKQVKTCAPGIDYKILVSQPHEVISMLKPLLNEENIATIAKLMDNLPPALHSTILPGIIYKTWINKLFFEVSRRATEEQWLAKLELSKDHFHKLTAEDIQDLSSELIFSNDAFNHIPLNCRLTILQETLKFCRSRQHIEDWGKAATQLQQWTTHLSSFLSVTTDSLINHKCHDFFRRLQLSKGENSIIENVREEIIKSDIPISSVILLFSLQSSTFSPLNQYLIDKLIEAKDSNNQDLISATLRRLGELLTDKPELSKDMTILQQQLSPLGADPNLEPSARLHALRLIQLTSTDIDDDGDESSIKRALYTTEAILASSWTDTTFNINLENEENINELYISLLQESKEWQQLMALSEILRAWQIAKIDCSYYWIKLINEMAERNNDKELFNLLTDIFKTSSLSAETLLELLKALNNTQEKLYLCLHTTLEQLHLHCIELIKEQDKNKINEILDDDLYELIIQHKLVHHMVNTNAYPYLIIYLLHPGHEHNLRSSIKQLINEGMHIEAATLHAHSIALPSSLLTFSTVNDIFPIKDYTS